MLTEKQKRFAFEYTFDCIAAKAYVRAGYSEKGADSGAHALMQKPEVLEMIEEYQERNARVARLDKNFVLNIWMNIALADPRDLVETVVRPCKECWPDGLVMTDPNPVCALCSGGGVSRVIVKDTSKLKGPARYLYAGAKQTKDGIEIKMHSRDEALKNLANYLGIAQKSEISGPGGGPIGIEAMADPSQLTTAQLRILAGAALTDGTLGVDLGVERKRLPLTIDGKRDKP